MRNSLATVVGLSLLVSAGAHAAPHGIFPTRQHKELFKSLGIPSANEAPKKLLYFGGPVISNVKVYTVMWGSGVDSTTQKQIAGYFKAVTDSTYMDWLKEYNTNLKAVDGRDGTHQTIGRGSFVSQIVITPSFTSKRIDDKNIQAELSHQIDIGVLPKPDDNTLFMTYFPPGYSITIEGMGSCSSFCAYHEGFKSEKHGNIFYGVMPDLGGACSFGCGPQPVKFDNLTSVSSHELIEAVTDPFPTPGSHPAYPQAWNMDDGSEIGDVCADYSTRLTTQGLTYILQQEFDNATASCAPGPYQSP